MAALHLFYVHLFYLQDHTNQLRNWKILLRSLKTSERLKADGPISSEIQFQEAKRYMLFLSDEGCANPGQKANDSNTNAASKKTVSKGTNSKSILIPRDLEKIIRSRKTPKLNASQLQAIRY